MMNIDPRLLVKFQANPAWQSTQSPQTVETAQYRQFSKKWTGNMRVVYEAVKTGYTDLAKPPVTVDMTAKDWKYAVDKLTKIGALAVVPAEGVSS